MVNMSNIGENDKLVKRIIDEFSIYVHFSHCIANPSRIVIMGRLRDKVTIGKVKRVLRKRLGKGYKVGGSRVGFFNVEVTITRSNSKSIGFFNI